MPTSQKKLKRFCPSCGITTDALFEGLCKECFLEKVELLEAAKRVQFSICHDCKKMRLNKSWNDYDTKDSLVRDIVVKHSRPLRGSRLSIYYNDFTVKGKTEVPVTLTAELNTVSGKVSKSKEMVLVILPEVCPFCSRLRGGYFEAIVQLRGEQQDKMQKFIENGLARQIKAEPTAFISKTEKLKEGTDLYVGSRNTAIKIATELRKLYNVECTITHKLHGMRKGKEIKRTTVLLRGIK